MVSISLIGYLGEYEDMLWEADPEDKGEDTWFHLQLSLHAARFLDNFDFLSWPGQSEASLPKPPECVKTYIDSMISNHRKFNPK